ncbi:MAG TPA: Rpn family recombination-promoting nuclease/putative transposase, partial [Thermotogota bacterium]|nr:Rpn family recombination-promoting nuclease/putative transposase [Thermotogota bacterium]
MDKKQRDSLNWNLKNPHDSFFKKMLGRKDIASAFLQAYLPKNLLGEFQLSTLNPQRGEFVDRKLKQHFSDLLFEVQRQGEPAYVYILVEHKSYPDSKVLFQLLGYMSKIWEEKLDSHTKKVPPILPILIYHGERKWDVNTNLLDMLHGGDKMSKAFLEFVPDFRFLAYDYSPESSTPIQGNPLLQIVLLAMRTARQKNREIFLKSVKQIVLIMGKRNDPAGIEFLDMIFYYLLHAQDRISVEDLAKAALERGDRV